MPGSLAPIPTLAGEGARDTSTSAALGLKVPELSPPHSREVTAALEWMLGISTVPSPFFKTMPP